MKVSLLLTCLCDSLYPDVGRSAVKVLQELGVVVDFPEAQTCCGQPAFNSGYKDDARLAAETMVNAFGPSDYVVSLSGSCAGMIRKHYPDLFTGHPKENDAKSLAAKTYEFSEFLVNVLKVKELPVTYEAKATFHSSCHMQRWLGENEAPFTILSMISGLEFVPLPESYNCCGFGGTFAVKMEEISSCMVEEKAQKVLSTGADLLLGCDMSCLMNIDGRLKRLGAEIRTKHLAQILAEGWNTSG